MQGRWGELRVRRRDGGEGDGVLRSVDPEQTAIFFEGPGDLRHSSLDVDMLHHFGFGEAEERSGDRTAEEIEDFEDLEAGAGGGLLDDQESLLDHGRGVGLLSNQPAGVPALFAVPVPDPTQATELHQQSQDPSQDQQEARRCPRPFSDA